MHGFEPAEGEYYAENGILYVIWAWMNKQAGRHTRGQRSLQAITSDAKKYAEYIENAIK